MKEDKLAAGLRKLAQTTVDEMNSQGTQAPLEDRLETIKIASALYFGLEKLQSKSGDEEPSGRNMRDWQREIRGENAQH